MLVFELQRNLAVEALGVSADDGGAIMQEVFAENGIDGEFAQFDGKAKVHVEVGFILAPNIMQFVIGFQFRLVFVAPNAEILPCSNSAREPFCDA